MKLFSTTRKRMRPGQMAVLRHIMVMMVWWKTRGSCTWVQHSRGMSMPMVWWVAGSSARWMPMVWCHLNVLMICWMMSMPLSLMRPLIATVVVMYTSSWRRTTKNQRPYTIRGALAAVFALSSITSSLTWMLEPRKGHCYIERLVESIRSPRHIINKRKL